MNTLVAEHLDASGAEGPAGTRVDMVGRMAYVLRVFGIGDGRSRLRATLGYRRSRLRRRTGGSR